MHDEEAFELFLQFVEILEESNEPLVGDVAVTTFFVKKSDACDEGAAMRIRAIAARRHPSLIRGLVEFLVPRGVCTQTPRGFELSDVTVGVARPEVVLTVLGSDTRRFGADTWLSTATRCPLASVLAWSHTSRLVPRRRLAPFMGEVRTRGWLLAVVRNLATTSSHAKPRVGIVLDRSDLLHLGRLARSTDGYENLRATGHVHRRDALVRRRPAHHVAIVTPTTGSLALAGLPVPWALAPRDGLVALPRASPSHESKTRSMRSKTGVSLSRLRPPSRTMRT